MATYKEKEPKPKPKPKPNTAGNQNLAEAYNYKCGIAGSRTPDHYPAKRVTRNAASMGYLGRLRKSKSVKEDKIGTGKDVDGLAVDIIKALSMAGSTNNNKLGKVGGGKDENVRDDGKGRKSVGKDCGELVPCGLEEGKSRTSHVKGNNSVEKQIIGRKLCAEEECLGPSSGDYGVESHQKLNQALLAKVLVTDMPGSMQGHAVGCARRTYDSMENFSAKLMAYNLKKEFDRAYGPVWHCIVGSSYGSFVTHCTGHFLYFHMEGLYILLFKTKVQMR